MLSLACSKRKEEVTKLLMVRPVCFGFNEQTASSNVFQHSSSREDAQKYALEEFDGMVSLLKERDVPVVVVEDTPEPCTPDSIFPNNWFSTHADGTLVLYPMFALNRRLERDPAIIRTIMGAAGTKRILDLSYWEDKGKFLESTGSMVLDRKGRVAYACRSPRTSEMVLDDFCRKMGYNSILFDAVDRGGNPIYHTNVVMSIGEKFAILCEDVVISPLELEVIESNLSDSGRKIVRISYDQMCHFAGNVLEVRNIHGERLLVMSQTAKESLTPGQLETLSGFGKILDVPVPHIEAVGGGSARCMIAEIICC
ncbi:MAG: amidinotransferase [Bacteroidales bacterium]|nr:amidinotransferase [Bacteroidales bacterium]